MGDDMFPVQLWQYDLTQGMARALSPMLLGELVEGVWHTSLVVHGVEYLFGYGVQRAVPGSTPFGQPLHKIDLGVTQVTKDLVEDLVNDLGAESFAPETYNLIKNNCNHFTNALSMVLVGQGIPAHILNQHEVLLRSPMGQSLMPMLQQIQGAGAANQLLQTVLSTAATLQMEGQLGRAGAPPSSAPEPSR